MVKQDDAQVKKGREEEELKDGEEGSVEERDEYEELEQRAQEWEEKYKRALADYQNLVKRVQEEKADWIRSANRELLLRILPLLDTLILAGQHSEDQTLKVTLQQFLDLLKAEGVERIKTDGKDFDPHLMEAIESVEVDPTEASGQEGKVVEEVRAGYILHDKLLRPAQVKVGIGSK